MTNPGYEELEARLHIVACAFKVRAEAAEAEVERLQAAIQALPPPVLTTDEEDR